MKNPDMPLIAFRKWWWKLNRKMDWFLWLYISCPRFKRSKCVLVHPLSLELRLSVHIFLLLLHRSHHILRHSFPRRHLQSQIHSHRNLLTLLFIMLQLQLHLHPHLLLQESQVFFTQNDLDTEWSSWYRIRYRLCSP